MQELILAYRGRTGGNYQFVSKLLVKQQSTSLFFLYCSLFGGTSSWEEAEITIVNMCVNTHIGLKASFSTVVFLFKLSFFLKLFHLKCFSLIVVTDK